MAFKDAARNAKKKTGTKGRSFSDAKNRNFKPGGGEIKKGMGFQAAAKNIQAKGKTKEQAGAILAEGARNASPEAKRKNPNLKKVR